MHAGGHAHGRANTRALTYIVSCTQHVGGGKCWIETLGWGCGKILLNSGGAWKCFHKCVHVAHASTALHADSLTRSPPAMGHVRGVHVGGHARGRSVTWWAARHVWTGAIGGWPFSVGIAARSCGQPQCNVLSRYTADAVPCTVHGNLVGAEFLCRLFLLPLLFPLLWPTLTPTYPLRCEGMHVGK